MSVVVLALGVLVLVVGAWVLVLPKNFQQWLGTLWSSRSALHAAILLRIVMGVALLGAAAESRFPLAFQVLGGIAILAAIGGYALGFDRLARWMEWWRAQSPAFLRLWSLLALGFGGFLVYGII